MIGRRNREALATLDATAESMTNLLGITPELVTTAPRVVIFPMSISDDRRSVSLSVEDGVPVEDGHGPTLSAELSLLERLAAFDDPLVEAGLGHLASYSAQRTIRIESAQGYMWGPSEPNRARLTGGFIQSIGAMRRIVHWLPNHNATPRVERDIARLARTATETLVKVVTIYPNKIFLPVTDGLTTRQADALTELLPKIPKRGSQQVRDKAYAILQARDRLPEGDPAHWSETLRTGHLMWRTPEERAELQRDVKELLERTRLES